MQLNTASTRMSTPIPKYMKTLERDERGYPIPFIVLRDKNNTPMFTINDQVKCEKARKGKLCAICGKRMRYGFWFVGGSRCFIHPRGAFIDPPIHYECGEYALQVCPFLAARSYSKRIDDAKLLPKNRPDNLQLLHQDHMPPNLPESFGIGHCTAYIVTENKLFVVPNKWTFVEWWHNGVRVNAPTVEDIRRLTT